MRPVEERTLSILQQQIDNTDLGRYERFKRWAKENMFGLASAAISVAGFIATIITLARSGLRQTDEAVGKLAKSIGEFGNKFGKNAAIVAGFIASVLYWGKKGIDFLAEHLWLIVVSIVLFLFYNKKK